MAQALRGADSGERLWGDRVPVAGKMKLRKETLVMVYVCEVTNLPLLVKMGKVKDIQ